MARLIAPDQFGVFAVALTVWSVLGTMAEFGLGTDLVRASDFQRRVPTVASMGLITSGVLALTMLLASGPISAAFDSPQSARIIALMSVSMFVFGFSIPPSAALQREFKQGRLFAINGAALVASTATMTTLALLNFGPIALAFGQIVGQVVTVVALYLFTRMPIRLGFNRVIARESAAFCLPLAFANLLSWLLLSVDNVVVARVMSPTQLGLYVLAFNVSSWPMNAIGQSIRVIALPAFSQVSASALRGRALTMVSGPLWAVSVLMGVLLAALAKPVITLLYGDRWTAAATALVGLAVFGTLRVTFDLMVTYLIAVGATRLVLAVQVWWLVVMVPAMIVGVRSFGLPGAGFTHVAVAVGAVLPAYLVCLHRVGVDWVAFIRAWALPTLAIIPAAAACLWVGQHVHAPLAALTLGGLALLVLYVLPIAPWWLRRISLLRHLDSPASNARTNR